jgi:hypothetical protein
MNTQTNFAAFILTHGRPDNVITYDQLRKQGYTGRIVVVVDDTDTRLAEYREKFGDELVVFDKRAIAKTFDTADNFDDMRTIVYARNACFDIAKRLGIRYFVQLDDDYTHFSFRFSDEHKWVTKDIIVRNLDRIFAAFIRFLKATPTKTIAMAQGGDFIGGKAGRFGSKITMSRKAMNSFFCDSLTPIQFRGRINEDVNTYTCDATTGSLFFTHNQVALNQKQTQSNSGGMTDVYLASGTYVKSFYTVMMHPSGVRVKTIHGQAHTRLHHAVNWKKTTPMILREGLKKCTE